MIGRIKEGLAFLGVLLAAAFWAWLRGLSKGRAAAQAKQDKDYRETRRRMDDATTDLSSASDAAVRKRLRDHARK